MGVVFTVTVATTVVTTVVGEGVAVRMQEQALLSRDGGYVVAGKSRFPRAAGAIVVLANGKDEESCSCLSENYLRGGRGGRDSWLDVGAAKATCGNTVARVDEGAIQVVTVAVVL